MRKKPILLSIAILLVMTAASVTYLFLRDDPEIPKDVLSKVNFLIYIPDSKASWQIGTHKPSFDEDSGTLTLEAKSGSTVVTLNEQTLPDALKDIPEQYLRILATLHEYSEIKTNLGTITLTKPEELKGGQTAVGNLNGTLLFAKPNRDLSDQEWLDFFKSMKVIH